MKGSDILIIGSKGQLGLALQAQYPLARAVDADELDITNPKAIESFNWSNIKIIINAAAYTNVDGAETTEGRILAWQINATALGSLVKIAQTKDITLVHISTDYVFDGTQDKHRETEPFSPLSVYGASKAAGDLLVSQLAKHFIIRTSWVIGEGKNFVRTMLELGAKNVNPSVVSDQIGRLTFTSELVRGIDHLLTSSVKYGTYNLTGDGVPASWADVAREIFKLTDLTKLTVTSVTTDEYYKNKDGVAPRPLKSTLSLDKIKNTDFHLHDWRDDLKQYLEKEKQS